ncbi:MAG TPA: DUF3348 family protein, partial [Ramlibacter sp.]|nr:DUF3348 family protein [Ramlibacter sp.]
MRPNFTSSRLVRLLRDPTEATVEASRQDVAEQLGEWVSAFDAMTVHSAHQAVQSVAAFRRAPGLPARAQALEAQFQRVRADLVASILTGDDADDNEAETSYVSFRQRHAEHQRQLETQIASLRAKVRQALSRSSAPLRQLAIMD